MTRTGFPIETKWEDGVYTLTMRWVAPAGRQPAVDAKAQQ
jgi:hypothetical protein